MQVKDTNRNRRDFGVLACICLVLQVAVAPNIALGNGRANLGLVFAGIASLLVGGRLGVLCGFLAGFVFDLSTTGPIGLMSFLLTIASFVLGIEARNRMADDFAGSMRLFSWMTLGVSLFYHVAMLLVGDATSLIDVVFMRTVPTAILTIIAFTPFAYVISHETGSALSLGGKPSKSARSHGSRYDIGNL
ncbi:MAG: rod shape-determining protein MreD [Atopobiaceae bacterium]|nr:rod shape-determining protein MreD [Atopobiaceae bacterium]